MTNKIDLNSDEGKQTIDSLMAKMGPAQQEEFKAALAANKPLHIHVAKDGTISLGEAAVAAAAAAGDLPPIPPEAVGAPAPEAPVTLEKDKPKKLSKIDEKRQQIFMDRLRRHMGKGMTEQQAVQAIQREDYEALPLDKKFARLESMVSNTFQHLAQEIMGLSQNHMSIADAFDINYRSIQKCFIKLGISNEEQQAFINEAQKEVIEDKQKAQAARQTENLNRVRAQREAAEKQAVEAELQNAESPTSNGVPPSDGADLPKEATVFG